jgi:CDP-diglyceride synthetase
MAYEHATARYRQWYAKLLRFYPKPYHERFGEGMEQTFNDLCRDRYKAGDGLFSFMLWTFADTFAGIIKENIKKENLIMMPILKSFGGLIISVIAAIAIIVSTYLTKNLDIMWIILIVLFITLPIWEWWIKDKG